ncbi:MAG TPA: hypothetical protein VJ508_09830 [Saprospiraceae bacterium]|nr:hypothetical protein [Saprospiraceae bacterium]
MSGDNRAIEHTILRVLHASDPTMHGRVFELEEAVLMEGVNASNEDILKVAKDMEDRGLLTNVEFGSHVRGSLTQEGHRTAETLH